MNKKKIKDSVHDIFGFLLMVLEYKGFISSVSVLWTQIQ